MGITGKKLRQYPAYTGSTSLGICLQNHEIDHTTRRFMKAIGYQGILDIGYRYDARDGRYKVLDVNPRVGSSFRLFVGTNGMDVVRALYLSLTGQPVPATRAHEGRKWIVENQDLSSCLVYRRDRKLTLWEFVKSFKGVKEAAWFATDDWKPFVRLCQGYLQRAMGWGVNGLGALMTTTCELAGALAV
jgi:predicted ATP-grasp superfamily ATP-dependent carboligase